MVKPIRFLAQASTHAKSVLKKYDLDGMTLAQQRDFYVRRLSILEEQVEFVLEQLAYLSQRLGEEQKRPVENLESLMHQLTNMENMHAALGAQKLYPKEQLRAIEKRIKAVRDQIIHIARKKDF